MESTDTPPIYDVKSQQSFLTKEDTIKLITKSARYFIKRPRYSGIPKDILIKIGGGCWFWSNKRQMWVADDRLFQDCFLKGQCDEITHEKAMKMMEEMK